MDATLVARGYGVDARKVGYDEVGAAVADGLAARRPLLLQVTIDAEVPELVHAATIAIVGEVTLDRLWHAVPSFPTRSEIWLRMLETYGL